jgi:hypothetical protein
LPLDLHKEIFCIRPHPALKWKENDARTNHSDTQLNESELGKARQGVKAVLSPEY